MDNHQLPPPDDARKPYTINHDLIRTTLERAQGEREGVSAAPSKPKRGWVTPVGIIALIFVVVAIGDIVSGSGIPDVDNSSEAVTNYTENAQPGEQYSDGTTRPDFTKSVDENIDSSISNGDASLKADLAALPSMLSICTDDRVLDLVTAEIGHHLVNLRRQQIDNAKTAKDFTGPTPEALGFGLSLAKYDFGDPRVMSKHIPANPIQCGTDVTLDLSNPAVGQRVLTFHDVLWNTQYLGSAASPHGFTITLLSLDGETVDDPTN